MLHSSNFVRLFHRQSFALYGTLVRKIERIGDNRIFMLRNIDGNIIALKSQLQGKVTYGVSKQYGLLEIYNSRT